MAWEAASEATKTAVVLAEAVVVAAAIAVAVAVVAAASKPAMLAGLLILESQEMLSSHKPPDTRKSYLPCCSQDV